MPNWYDTIVTAIKTAVETVYIKKSDIADNLTTDNSAKVLSAKQGKALNDKIGNIIIFFNGSGNE